MIFCDIVGESKLEKASFKIHAVVEGPTLTKCKAIFTKAHPNLVISYAAACSICEGILCERIIKENK